MYSRLKKWMESERLKSSKLADNIGVSRATISHILSGRNKPSIDFFQKLLSTYPDLNSNWLITGIGYMRTKNETKETTNSIIAPILSIDTPKSKLKWPVDNQLKLLLIIKSSG